MPPMTNKVGPLPVPSRAILKEAGEELKGRRDSAALWSLKTPHMGAISCRTAAAARFTR